MKKSDSKARTLIAVGDELGRMQHHRIHLARHVVVDLNATNVQVDLLIDRGAGVDARGVIQGKK